MRQLIVNPGTENAWEIPLESGVISLGRNSENSFPIEHPSIAGEHCLVTVMDSGVVVKNLTTDNHTFVEGKTIDEALLLPGQTLRLGDVILRFEAKSTPVKLNPPPATLTLLSAASENLTFWKLANGAFLYPFKHDGLILLIAGTIFYVVINFLSSHAAFVGLAVMFFGTGYLFNYLQRILKSSAMGENRMPDWPDFSDLSDVIDPFVQFLGIVLFSFGPLILLRIFAPPDTAWKIPAIIVAATFGCVYFPMSFSAVTMFDSLGALNPLPIISSIVKIFAPYFLTVVLLLVIVVMDLFGNALLDQILPIPILPDVISEFISLYLLTVEMRILGLLYWTRKDELGWFDH